MPTSSMRSSERLVRTAALLLLLGAAPATHARRCPGPAPVDVQAHSDTDWRNACEGAQDALRFLAPLKMNMPERVRIFVSGRLPPGLRRDAVGCYAHTTHDVTVLDYPHFLARKVWFGVPIDRALYRAVFAHEVAHAMVGCNHPDKPLPTPAHEYAAYVVMFATMAPALREQALAALPGPGFESEQQINPITYGFDPMQFGAESYRHWRRQPEPEAFLRRVIAGEAVPDFDLLP